MIYEHFSPYKSYFSKTNFFLIFFYVCQFFFLCWVLTSYHIFSILAAFARPSYLVISGRGSNNATAKFSGLQVCWNCFGQLFKIGIWFVFLCVWPLDWLEKNWVKRGQVDPESWRLPNFWALWSCEAIYIPFSSGSGKQFPHTVKTTISTRKCN